MPNSHSTNELQSPFGEEINTETIETLCAQYGLTRKRLFFAEKYIEVLNARKAAIFVGYASPTVEGSRLLSDANVQKYLNDRFRQLRMRSDEVLGRLADIARGDIGDYLRVAKEKETDMPLIIDGKIIDGIYIDLKKLIEDGNTARIKKYSRVRGEVSIELHDPTKALELIGKHLRLWADVQATDPNPVRRADDLTDDDLAAIAAADLAREATPESPHGPQAGGRVSSGAEDASGPYEAAHEGNDIHQGEGEAGAADPRAFEVNALRQMIANLDAEAATLAPHSSELANAQRTLTTYRKRLEYLERGLQ